jgi:Rrf2 family protein
MLYNDEEIMRLSSRSLCGTRILLDLAHNDGQGPVKIGEISKRQGISVKYLEQLIRPLKKAQFVTSFRGPKGGHKLAKKPEDVTLGQIVRLLESQSELVGCISCPEKCPMSDDCKSRMAWKEATQALFHKLDATTIADLMSGKTYANGRQEACDPRQKQKT